MLALSDFESSGCEQSSAKAFSLNPPAVRLFILSRDEYFCCVSAVWGFLLRSGSLSGLGNSADAEVKDFLTWFWS